MNTAGWGQHLTLHKEPLAFLLHQDRDLPHQPARLQEDPHLHCVDRAGVTEGTSPQTAGRPQPKPAYTLAWRVSWHQA